MKIGILTFHWATNYGAILQCLALQTTLEKLGHSVQIINYKPKIYDENLYTFIRYRKFLDLKNYIERYKKERALTLFRARFLNQTSRFFSYEELSSATENMDVLISGSDQVMNPFFLRNGEGNGISPAYFLGFPFNGRKIAYAVSFGCVEYPISERTIASKYINSFDQISVREGSGIDIVKSMGYERAILVPDPTLLMASDFYNKFAEEKQKTNDYVYSFFIRHITERKRELASFLHDRNVIWNNNDGDYTMQGWLSKIQQSSIVVTDSFHCMVMCLKLHKPFAVVTEEKGNVGMNDRFYTLLNHLKLSQTIFHKSEINKLATIQYVDFDWQTIDQLLSEYAQGGIDFLKKALS